MSEPLQGVSKTKTTRALPRAAEAEAEVAEAEEPQMSSVKAKAPLRWPEASKASLPLDWPDVRMN